jgi:branched-chain amino acid transport system substrate-binding protein
MATFGRIAQSGITLAFDEWNNQGGVSGHRLEWVVFDSGCDFETAQMAVQQALEEGFKFFIGPICSEATLGAVVPLSSANGLMLSPTATHPLVTVNGQGQTRAMIFRGSYTYQRQAQAAALFARDRLKINKAAVLAQPNDDYSAALADNFAHQFVIAGGEVVYQAVSSPNAQDFPEILSHIYQVGAELIYLPGSAPVANQTAQRLRDLGFFNAASSSNLNLILLGSDGWESDDLDRIATQNSYFPVHFTPADQRPPVQDWIQRYKSANSVEPTTLAALSYDAAHILAAAIARSGSLEPLAVAKVLEQNKFEAITGPISFDHFHNPIKPVPFVQVHQEGLVYIASVLPEGNTE